MIFNESPKPPLLFTTIGTSTITGHFLAAAATVEGVVVRTVYSREIGRGRAFAAEHGLPYATDDVAAALAACDAVYIASPNSVHAEQIRAALDAGCHVLVEKPATTDAQEFAELTALAETRGLVLLEAMRNLYMPAFDRLRTLLPLIGPVRQVRFSYAQRSARYDLVLRGERVNIFDPSMGGGALLDLGVYCVAAAVALFGEPTVIAASAVELPGGADGAGGALLTYDGFIAQLEYSKVTRSAAASEIQGERGTLAIDRVAEPALIGVNPLQGPARRERFPVIHHGMSYEIRRFVELVKGRPSEGESQQTARTLRVMHEIRRVAASTPSVGCP